MSITYKINVEEDILRVKASGKDDSLEDVKNYGMAILEAAITSGCVKVLCDETDLEYSLSNTETFESARYMAENAPKSGKLAIVCKREQMADGFFWETVAVNRGLKVKTCQSPEEAEDWLNRNEY